MRTLKRNALHHFCSRGCKAPSNENVRSKKMKLLASIVSHILSKSQAIWVSNSIFFTPQTLTIGSPLRKNDVMSISYMKVLIEVNLHIARRQSSAQQHFKVVPYPLNMPLLSFISWYLNDCFVRILTVSSDSEQFSIKIADIPLPKIYLLIGSLFIYVFNLFSFSEIE